MGKGTSFIRVIKFIFLFTIFFSGISLSTKSQDCKDYLSEYWDSYYDKNPSQIEKSFNASDFNSVIDKTGFIPQTKQLSGDVSLLKKLFIHLALRLCGK